MDSDSWLRAAVELTPLVSSCRQTGEAGYRMAPAVVEALGDAGLFRLALPPGSRAAATLVEFVDIHEQLGYADPSVAWASANSNAAAGLIARLPPEHGRDLIGSGVRFIGVGLPATGRARMHDGELVIDGRWPLVSGAADADWFAVHCLVEGGPEAPDPPGAAPEARFVLVPADLVEVEDTWAGVVAMRGSGSSAVSTRAIRVPFARSIGMFGPAAADDPVSRLNATAPIAVAALAVAAISVGIGRYAVESAVGQAGSRVSVVSGTGWASWPSVQNTVATVDMAVLAARAALKEVVAEAQEQFAVGELEAGTRAHLYSVTEHAVTSIRHGISDLFTVGSVDALRTGHGLEQSLRDIHAFAVNWERYRRLQFAAGRALLGGDPHDPLY